MCYLDGCMDCIEADEIARNCSEIIELSWRLKVAWKHCDTSEKEKEVRMAHDRLCEALAIFKEGL